MMTSSPFLSGECWSCRFLRAFWGQPSSPGDMRWVRQDCSDDTMLQWHSGHRLIPGSAADITSHTLTSSNGRIPSWWMTMKMLTRNNKKPKHTFFAVSKASTLNFTILNTIFQILVENMSLTMSVKQITSLVLRQVCALCSYNWAFTCSRNLTIAK